MFGRPLPLFSLPDRLITPLRTGVSAGLRWICQNHLKRCCMSFSSTGATSSLSRMSLFRTRSLLVLPQIHRSMRISAMLSYWTCRLLIDQHSASYNMVGRIAVLYNLPFSFSDTLGSHKTPEAWRHFDQPALILWLRSSSISPSRSQVAKGVFLGYHLNIESNIPLLMRGSTEITLHILCFRPTKPKIFCLQSSSSQL
jgi:hypothetical protein